MNAPLAADVACARPGCGHGEDLHDGICFGTSCECVRFIEPITNLADGVAVYGAFPMPVGPKPQPLSPARLVGVEERAARLYEHGNDVPVDEWNRLAGDDVPLLVAEVRRQAAEIAELNESVSVAAEALRARQAACACPPETPPAPHQVGCPQAEVPSPLFPTVAALRELSSREEPHDSPLRHDYRVGHDLPATGGGA